MDADFEQIGMKSQHRQAIQSNFKNLVDNCDIDLLLPKLLDKNVYTKSMITKYYVSSIVFNCF